MSERVLSTDRAKSAAQQMNSLLNGSLRAQLAALKQQGQALCSPAVWDGPAAARFRSQQWPPMSLSMDQALRALASLEKSAQTAVDDIVRAGSEGGMGDKAKSGLAGLWDRTEPGRKLAELVLAPFDIVAADHWIDLLKEMAGQPREWVKDLDEKIAEVAGLQQAGEPASEELQELAGKADRTAAMFDAWDAFAPGWLRAAARSISEIRGLSYALTGLGLVADASDLISPQDHGVPAAADRLAAGANAAGLLLQQGIERGLVTFKPAAVDGAGAEASAELAAEGGVEASEAAEGGLVALNASMDWIPGAGEVVIVGTGVYLAGDVLYHHVALFHDAANAVGHATVRAADDIGGGIEHGVHSLINDVTDWGSF